MCSNFEIDIEVKEPAYGVNEELWPAVWNNYRFINNKTNEIHHFLTKIIIRQIKCPYCKEFFFDEDDYMHILEHEITEAVCCKVYSMEQITPPKWQAEGFNNLFETFHMLFKTHRCGLCRFHMEYG